MWIFDGTHETRNIWLTTTFTPMKPKKRSRAREVRFPWFKEIAIWSGAVPRTELLQVVFILDPEDTIFVIHARSLTEKEKKRFRRRTK